MKERLTVSSQIGRFGNERGTRAERRVAAIVWGLIGTADCPPWLIGYEPATPEEDSRGVDGWIETVDVGRIAVQFKSSEAGANKARARKSSCKPVIVVVKSHQRDSLIFQRVIDPVAARRELYLRERRERLLWRSRG